MNCTVDHAVFTEAIYKACDEIEDHFDIDFEIDEYVGDRVWMKVWAHVQTTGNRVRDQLLEEDQ